MANLNICNFRLDFPLFQVANSIPTRYARLMLTPNEPATTGQTLYVYEIGLSE